jgi:hypothetical protein
MAETQSLNRVREQAKRQAADMSGFDFSAPAELFPSRSRKTRGPVAYKRFDRAAEAVRYAVEELPPSALVGATLEVNEVRFGHLEIQSLYSSDGYPLRRRATAS